MPLCTYKLKRSGAVTIFAPRNYLLVGKGWLRFLSTSKCEICMKFQPLPAADLPSKVETALLASNSPEAR